MRNCSQALIADGPLFPVRVLMTLLPAGRGRMSEPRSEPSLRELMRDPILHRLMASDGVGPDQLGEVIRDARARLGHR